jgi:hypothetical protein
MGTVNTKTIVAFETFSATSNTNLGLNAGGAIKPVPTSGDTKGEALPRLPLIFRNATSKIVINKGKLETVNVQVGTVTAQNSTDYTFKVRQIVNGVLKVANFFYTSDATATQTEIVTAIKDTFNAQNAQGGVSVVATGTTSVTLTGAAGEPLFDVYDVSSNIVFASGMGDINTALQAGSISNAAPRVVTAVAHGLLTGQTITFTDVAGAGAATVNGIQWRITRTGADTFTLDASTAGGAVTELAATGTLVAQEAYGTPTQVDANFEANGQTYVATTGQVYDSYDIISMPDPSTVFTARIWCNAFLAASPNTATTNYSQFVADVAAYQTTTPAGNVTIAKMFGIPSI